MLRLVLVCALLFGASSSALSAETYVSGRISNFTFVGDQVLFMIDVGAPTNCAGTPAGWIAVRASYKPLQAFLIGLWLRGDASSTQVTVYTMPVDSSGYCQAFQIDPAN